MRELNKQYHKNAPLTNLVLRERNFRDIYPENFERLKRKSQELGAFKPLVAIKGRGDTLRVIGGVFLINKDGGKKDFEEIFGGK